MLLVVTDLVEFLAVFLGEVALDGLAGVLAALGDLVVKVAALAALIDGVLTIAVFPAVAGGSLAGLGCSLFDAHSVVALDDGAGGAGECSECQHD